GRDVTEKKVIEQQREFDRGNLKALINNTHDLMWSVDRDLNLITANEAFDKMVKAMPDQTIAKASDSPASDINSESLNRFYQHYHRAFSGESFTEIEHSKLPEDGWSEISFYPIYHGAAIIGAACFSRDITGRKVAEENLKALERQILEQLIHEQKNIARAIIKTQEKERNHLGQELHDNVNQILASIRLYLEMAEHDNEKIKELIKYTRQLLDVTIEEIRLLCQKLVTPNKNIDLEMLIRDLLVKLDQTKIKTDLTYSAANELLSDDLKLNIYRIIQEQFNNIVKYAGAENVNVSVKTENGVIHVVVADDGKGFDVKEKRKGIGISNIINRVDSFSGELAIESAPGKGCSIVISVPY
ncbi:MAG: putative signal transduction histidine kinase, partial [Chitinophagaceae bacterium]|nr:putative signal transduction histidine kinase [Chitinophagaceae bacterium]